MLDKNKKLQLHKKPRFHNKLGFPTLLCGMMAISLVTLTMPANAQVNELDLLIQQMVEKKMGELSTRMGVVINLSGRQRMLTQKMSKEMLLIYLGVEPKQNRAELGKSAILFSDTLRGLINGDPKQRLPETSDHAILAQLGMVNTLWQDFSENVLSALSGQVDEGLIQQMAAQNLPLLSEMNKAVYMYEEAAGADLKTLAPVVNLSGRQRMLSQKMTKEYLLIAAGINKAENQKSLQQTVALFDKTLKGLRDGDAGQRLPGTTQPDIRAQLDVVAQRWDEFRPLLEQGDYSEAQIRRIAALNLPLLKEMNAAVKMYEKLSDA